MFFFLSPKQITGFLITDNYIIGFAKLVEVVAKTISFGTHVLPFHRSFLSLNKM